MNRLSKQKRSQVVAALVEGNSVRSTVRMTGVCKKAVLKLLVDLGKACAEYQDRTLRNLSCKRIQCDEIFSFCYAKDKNLPEELKGKFGFGSVWTWTALCADTKLMVSWLIGERSTPYAVKFIDDLASRLAHRVQLTTDGHRPYLRAVEMPLVAMWIMRCWKSYTRLRHSMARLDIVRLNVAEPRPIKSWAIPILSIFRRAL